MVSSLQQAALLVGEMSPKVTEGGTPPHYRSLGVAPETANLPFISARQNDQLHQSKATQGGTPTECNLHDDGGKR